MLHRLVFVGAHMACLAICLLWTGCGESTSRTPSTDRSASRPVTQPAEPAASPPAARSPAANRQPADAPQPEARPEASPEARPADPPRPVAGHRKEAIAALNDAPIAAESPAAPTERVDREQLHRAIDLAMGYLVRSCGDDGQFVYRVNLDPAVTPAPKYNLLRHAGTIYALAMYAGWRSDPSSVEAVALRAADFLKRRAIAPVEGRDGLLAVWSRPEIGSSVDQPEAKLGGAGLALLALAGVERIQPGTTPPADLQATGRFVLYLQKSDGSFFSKYIPSQGGRSDAWTSLYYPGEAALGLLELYELDPQRPWREAAERALKYLARRRRDRITVEPDHWALLATARLFDIADREGWEIDRPALTFHAAQICKQMVDDLPRYRPSRATAGCLTNDGRTCPTATRLEGLQAALTFLPEDYIELRRRIVPVIDEAMAFLVRAQVPSGPHAGGIPRSVLPVTGEEERCGEIRIDYVQHALSAMLQYDAQRFTSP